MRKPEPEVPAPAAKPRRGRPPKPKLDRTQSVDTSVSEAADKAAKALKMREVAARRKRERANSRIVVEDWVIFRMDEANYVLAPNTPGSTDYYYYPTLEWAFKSLFDKLVGKNSKQSVKSVLDAIKEAKNQIMEAFGE